MLESPALNVRTRDGTVRIIYIHLRRGFSGEQVVKYRTTGTGIGQGPQLPGHVGQWRAVVERRDDICSGLRGLQPHCVQELALVADRRVSDAVIFFSRKRFTPDKTIDELRFFFFPISSTRDETIRFRQALKTRDSMHQAALCVRMAQTMLPGVQFPYCTSREVFAILQVISQKPYCLIVLSSQG